MKHTLAAFTLLEALLSFVASGFIVLLFSALSLNIFDRYTFQKSFYRGQQQLDTLRLQISNHLRKAFAPSISIMPDSIQWKEALFAYPIVLESTDHKSEFILTAPLPLQPYRTFEVYCVDSDFYTLASYTQITKPILKFHAEPPSCELAYLIGQEKYELRYDSHAKTLHVRFAVRQSFQVENFGFSYMNNSITMSLCLKDEVLNPFICRRNEHLEICAQGQCVEWVVIL